MRCCRVDKHRKLISSVFLLSNIVYIFNRSSEGERKNKEVKRSTRPDKRSHVEKLAKSAEESAFVGDLGEVYKITKE